MTAATRTRPTGLDALCAEAVELARTAANDVAGLPLVGDHLGVEPDGERVVNHSFVCLSPAYVGWYWSVTVARASRGKIPTVDEVCLLPGEGAILAPSWVPYAERLLPGDLGPGDLLPTLEDDDRLVPGYTGGYQLRSGAEPDDVLEVAYELGLTRPRVLSLIGLDDAADRWVNGVGGPHVPLSIEAPGRCVGCGFLVQLPGLLGQAFGVCANESSPSDGRVVTLDHGCGAHSEAVRVLPLSATTAHVIDDVGYDEFGHG